MSCSSPPRPAARPWRSAGLALRDRFNAILGAHPALCRELAIRLSGLAIRYPGAGQVAGQRAPDADLRVVDPSGAPADTIFGLLHPAKSVLLSLGAAAAAPAGFAGRLDIVTAELAGDHPEWAGVRAVLIRPDGYIAWATHADDAPPLATWLGNASFRVPRAAFRAVSGLVLALFITTVAVVGITTWNAQQLTLRVSAAEATVLTDQLADLQPGSASQASTGPAAPAAPLAAKLSGIHGVQGVVVVRADPQLTIPAAFHHLGANSGSNSPVPAGVVSCAQLATVPVLGRCPAGATAAAFPANGFAGPLYGVDATGITWPAANVAGTRLDSLAVDAINVMTNGTVPAVEQARTVLENAPAYAAYLGDGVPSTVGELIAHSNPTNSGYQQLANTVILVSLPIAGCTLAAGIAAGLADRKRPFSLLRLTGARLATLRRVVAVESAVPLLAVAAVAIGTGFGAAAMYASLEMQHPMVAPGAAYYLLTAGGILAALGIIAATFPLLARITGPEVARNE